MVEKISKAHRRLSKIKMDDILMTYDYLMIFDIHMYIYTLTNELSCG